MLESRRSTQQHEDGHQKHGPDDLSGNRSPQRDRNRQEKHESATQGPIETEPHDSWRQVAPDQTPSMTRVPPGGSEEEVAQSQGQGIKDRGQRLLLIAPKDRGRKGEERDQKQGSKIQRNQPTVIAPNVFEALVMAVPDRGDRHKAADVAEVGRRLAE